jgi:hypothetical protein
MPKYYSLMLSPHISKTPEGYLICRDVAICRSGFQEYKGAELSRFPGYEHSWNLNPEESYKVYRPPDEVLHPDTIASFEGKTVVNEHPQGDAVYIDNDGELTCGHIQSVGRGVDLPPSEEMPDGAVTLKGDLHIKDPELVEKIWPSGDPESGVRDISCGYSLRLKRLGNGTLVMTHIRGNHVAVVEKGRAGSLIAIQDSAPKAKAEILVAICDSAPPEINAPRRKIMTIKELIFGRGVKAIMPDASPEEVNAVLKDLEDKPNAKPLAAATDSLTKQDELAAEHPHRVAAHAALDRCLDARGANDYMGKDAFGKPSHLNNLKRELLKFIEEEEAEEAHAAAGEEGKPAAATAEAAPPPAAAVPPPEEEDAAAPPEAKPEIEELSEGTEPEESEAGGEETPPEEMEAETPPEENDGESEEEEEEEPVAGDAEVTEKGESVLKQANDSFRAYIRATKPVIAAIVAKPKAKRTRSEVLMVDSYNQAVRGANAAGPAYRVLAKVKVPPRIPALAVDAEKARVDARAESDLIASFYEGVPWNKGKERHDLYLTTKGSK